MEPSPPGERSRAWRSPLRPRRLLADYEHQAAEWLAGNSVSAKSLGSLNITGSTILPGDFLGGTITLAGTPGATTNTLGTFKVARNISTNPTVITINNGGVGTFSVGQSISSALTLSVLGGAGGTIGSFTAGEWTGGGSLTALSIGTLTTTGLAGRTRPAASSREM